jgi:hypothetical protein
MEPTVLIWALAQPAGTRAAVLAAAFTGGTMRVTFGGRTVEYRSLDELGRALPTRRRRAEPASLLGAGNPNDCLCDLFR